MNFMHPISNSILEIWIETFFLWIHATFLIFQAVENEYVSSSQLVEILKAQETRFQEIEFKIQGKDKQDFENAQCVVEWRTSRLL